MLNFSDSFDREIMHQIDLIILGYKNLPLPVCRNFARTNADLPEQARPICSPVSSAVPIAVRNCTTVPAIVLKPDKTTSYAPLPVKRVRRSATPTSSVPSYWKKAHSNT